MIEEYEQLVSETVGPQSTLPYDTQVELAASAMTHQGLRRHQGARRRRLARPRHYPSQPRLTAPPDRFAVENHA